MERHTNSDKLEALADSTEHESAQRYLGHLGLVDALAEPAPLSPEHEDEWWAARGLE